MKITNILKRGVSFLFHGPVKPIYAEINYFSPANMLKGKKIVVTGGGRGLGYAMAKKFVSEGADVIISGRDEKRLKCAAAELNCRYKVFDVCRLDLCGPFIAEVYEELHGIDVLVNNAGISLHETSFFDVTPDTFSRQLKTNLEAPFFLAQAFIKILIDNNRKGSILFLSSETGETVDFRPYGYTKAAINSMVRGLANLFNKYQIRINAIAPGVTASDMTGISENGDLNAGNYGSGRYYLPDEIAQVAAMVISDAMGVVSGQIITCNNAHTVNPRWR